MINITLLNTNRTHVSVDEKTVQVATDRSGYTVVEGTNMSQITVNYTSFYRTWDKSVIMTNAQGRSIRYDLPGEEDTFTFNLPIEMTIAPYTKLLFQAINSDKIQRWTIVDVPIARTAEGQMPPIPSGDAEAIRADLAKKQDKTDNALATTAKTIVGAINELHAGGGSGGGTVVKIAGQEVDTLEFTENPQTQITTIQNQVSGKYTKPSSGIPETDLSQDVQTKLNAEKGGAPITRVTALPTANQAEFEKNLIYEKDNSLNYMKSVPSDEKTFNKNDNALIYGDVMALGQPKQAACKYNNNLYIFGATKDIPEYKRSVLKINAYSFEMTILHPNYIGAGDDITCVGAYVYQDNAYMHYKNGNEVCIAKFNFNTETFSKIEYPPDKIYDYNLNVASHEVYQNKYIYYKVRGTNNNFPMIRFNIEAETFETAFSSTKDANFYPYENVIIGDKIYYADYGTIRSYDLTNNSSVIEKEKNSNIYQFSGVGAIGNDMYLFGGNVNSSATNKVYKYNIISKSLTLVPSSEISGFWNCISPITITEKNAIYIIGGWSFNGAVKSVGSLSISDILSYSELATKADVTNLQNIVNTNEGLIQDAFTEIDTLKLETIPAKQDKTDEALQTKDKTIVGAINELNAGGGGGKGSAPITRVTALPTANQTEYNKRLIYGSGNSLKYIDKKTSTNPTIKNIAEMSNRKNYPSCASVGTDIYVFGGNNSGSGDSSEILKFNTLTNTVETLSTTLPSRRQGASCASVGTDIYVFGGYGGRNLSEILKFDTTTNTIQTLGTRLPSERAYTTCASVGTDIYIFGGNSNSSEILKFNTSTNTIQTLGTRLPSERSNTSCASVGTDIYVFGGYSGGYLLEILKFNTLTNTIQTLGTRLPSGRAYTTCASVGTDIYIFGGSSNSGNLSEILKFDTTTNTIQTLGTRLPSERSNTSCASVGTDIYVFGGYGGGNLPDILQFSVGFNYSFSELATKTDINKITVTDNGDGTVNLDIS